MELPTTEGYGKNSAGSGNVIVNVGSLVVGGKLAAVARGLDGKIKSD